jgi:hypothetical protein
MLLVVNNAPRVVNYARRVVNNVLRVVYYALELSIMLLQLSIMLLELSIMLLEDIYSTGITHNDHNVTMFIVQAAAVSLKITDFPPENHPDGGCKKEPTIITLSLRHRF